jgi:hypothetical protein
MDSILTRWTLELVEPAGLFIAVDEFFTTLAMSVDKVWLVIWATVARSLWYHYCHLAEGPTAGLAPASPPSQDGMFLITPSRTQFVVRIAPT